MAATNFFLFKEKHFTNHVTVTFNGPILGRGGEFCCGDRMIHRQFESGDPNQQEKVPMPPGGREVGLAGARCPTPRRTRGDHHTPCAGGPVAARPGETSTPGPGAFLWPSWRAAPRGRSFIQQIGSRSIIIAPT